MPNWFRNKKSKPDEVQWVSALESVSDTPVDLEIEKKWLQLIRVDPSNFEFFYRKYYDTILVFISGEIKDPEVAQELTNEVFSVAMDQLDKFHWQGYSFGAWLFQIARNLRHDQLRKQNQSPEVPWNTDSEEVEDSNESFACHENNDDIDALAYCIDELDPVCRQVFKAHYWSKLKVREVAVVLDLSQSNVKVHLQRGRIRLLRCLLKNGVERGISAEKMKMISEWMANEEGWEMLRGEDHESS